MLNHGFKNYLLKLTEKLCALFYYPKKSSLLEKAFIQNTHRYSAGLFVVLICLLLSGCGEMVTANFSTVLINLSNSYPALWKLVTACAYMFGLVFIFRGVFGLKVYGDMRTMMSSGSNIKGPLILLLVGAALMFFPTTKSVFLETTFGVGQQDPLSYSTVKGMDVETFRALLGFVQLVGVISFVRGWIILAHSASPSSQSQFPKAIIHIIAGLLAINIQGTINLVNATLY